MNDIDAEINAKIASAKNISIVSHVRPDENAVGADLIHIVSAIEDHVVSMIFVEPCNTVKISWHALQPGMDVSQIATHFDGGGHKAATGADISGSLEEIQTRVLQTTRGMLIL